MLQARPCISTRGPARPGHARESARRQGAATGRLRQEARTAVLRRAEAPRRAQRAAELLAAVTAAAEAGQGPGPVHCGPRHKSARRFDGYKGHTAVDPDSELITATAVTPPTPPTPNPSPEPNDLLQHRRPHSPPRHRRHHRHRRHRLRHHRHRHRLRHLRPTPGSDTDRGHRHRLRHHRHRHRLQTPEPTPTQAPRRGAASPAQDRFGVDLLSGTVTCPDDRRHQSPRRRPRPARVRARGRCTADRTAHQHRLRRVARRQQDTDAPKSGSENTARVRGRAPPTPPHRWRRRHLR